MLSTPITNEVTHWTQNSSAMAYSALSLDTIFDLNADTGNDLLGSGLDLFDLPDFDCLQENTSVFYNSQTSENIKSKSFDINSFVEETNLEEDLNPKLEDSLNIDELLAQCSNIIGDNHIGMPALTDVPEYDIKKEDQSIQDDSDVTLATTDTSALNIITVHPPGISTKHNNSPIEVSLVEENE